LLHTLQKAFDYIENESFASTFQGLFSEINLNSEKLGKQYTDRNAKLCTIITKIAEGLKEFSTDSDTLGDAYEYLIGQFAAGSGKKAGEFYTPQQISTILSAIVTLDSQEPATGKKRYLDNVLDFACGSGSLLLNVRHQMGPHGIGKIYGQEKNITTYNLARMNMLLHGVKDSEFEIFHGDTLLNDWEMLREANPAKKKQFDAVVANPPFSYRWELTDAMGDDVRFKNYGLAPKSAADFAFLLHGFQYLAKEGTMAIILPHGVLFRGGVESVFAPNCSRTAISTPSLACPPISFSPPVFPFAFWCSKNARSLTTCSSSMPASTLRKGNGRTGCGRMISRKLLTPINFVQRKSATPAVSQWMKLKPTATI
jgi:type I restriction enzyme M protein